MLRSHERLFEYIKRRYFKVFEGTTADRGSLGIVNFKEEIAKYIDSINRLNHIVCEGRPTEIAALESKTVEDYYSTVHTWITINDERKKSLEPPERKKLTSGNIT